MRRALLSAAFAVALTSCASTTPYTTTTGSTARVRLVAQGAGNAYFAVPPALKCSTKFGGDPFDDGDRRLAVLHGKKSGFPSVRSPILLGMPGAERYPEWTYLELQMDADRDTLLRTTFITQVAGSNPYDVNTCNSLSTIRFDAGKDYEVVFSAAAGGCSLALYQLVGSGASVNRIPVQPVSGPQGCR